MEFKNVEEMLRTKYAYQIEKMRFVGAIKEAIQSRKEVKGKSKNYWTEVIKTYKQRVSGIDENIKNISQDIIKLSTFPNEILIPFLIECINRHEIKSFVCSNVTLSYNFNYTEHVLPIYVNYSLIFPECIKDEEEALEKTFYISRMPFAYKELFESTESKYLMIPNNYEMSLIIDDKLNPYFNEFPYLERIGFDLINRRLLEPEKPLIDILNEELEEQKIKVLKRN